MFSTYKEVWKIVRNSIQTLQIVAFALSAFIGVFVILFAIYAYLDFKEVVTKDTSIFKEEFVIVSKKVTAMQALTSKATGFTKRDVSEIKKQEFCTAVAQFEPSRFHVLFYSDSKTFPLKTDLFFETVPNKYLSLDEQNWQWEQGQEMIPIILPRDFLTLYNFGFAATQNLPQISEGILKQLVFKVRLRGNGKSQIFSARVADFSDRINTILVPQTFLNWANAEFGYKNQTLPSRIILETENIADSRIFEYVAQNNYEINENSLVNSKLSFYLKLTLTVVVLIGVVITLLAVWLLVFSFHLIIEKNKSKIQNLFYLGYSFNSILLPYNLISIVTNTVIVVFAFVASSVSNTMVVDKLSQFLPIAKISVIVPILSAIFVLSAILLINYTSIRRVLKKTVS